MLALAASILLTVYLIVPEALFRLIFGRFVPMRNFVLTRTETVHRAALLTIIPLGLALSFVYLVPGAKDHPFSVRGDSLAQRHADYKLLTADLYSEEEFRNSKTEFWSALDRSKNRQLRVLFWFYIILVVEAGLAAWLACKRPHLKNDKNRIRIYLADHFVFPHISQWHVLLTPFMVPGSSIEADILAVNGTLYKGKIGAHFLDGGRLSGLILTEPFRYRREDYLKAKENGARPNTDDFWTPIPSAKLYFAADKILNMNLRYTNPEGIQKVVKEVVGSDKELSITIDPAPSKKPPDAPSITPPKPEA